MDFDEEGAEEPDAEAWETEDDEGVEDGMEAQDDSEVTFSLHSGEWWPWAAAAGVSPGTCAHPVFPQSKGVQTVLARQPCPCCSGDSHHDSGLRCFGLCSFLTCALVERPFEPPPVVARPELGRKLVLVFPYGKN